MSIIACINGQESILILIDWLERFFIGQCQMLDYIPYLTQGGLHSLFADLSNIIIIKVTLLDYFVMHELSVFENGIDNQNKEYFKVFHWSVTEHMVCISLISYAIWDLKHFVV